MPETIKVPIAGLGSTTPVAPTAAPASTPDTPPATPAAPDGAEIPRELSPLERFHPSLDPAKVELTFDEQTGRVKVIPKAVEETPAEDPVDEAPAFEAPAAPAASPAAAQESATEVQQLRGEVGQLTQALTLMLQAQMSGKPLGELLGVPQAPAEPDYSQYDLYEPDQRAAFIRQLRQDVKAEVMREHQPTMEASRRRMEYDSVAAKYGPQGSHSDPNFQNKAVAAIHLVQQNPHLTIDQAYGLVNQISQTLVPAQAQVTAPQQQAAANNAQRTTLTPEQQQQKAEQAKKLPQQGSGVRGAGMPNLPKHIKGLGNIRAWVAQQAQLGNL